MDNDLFGYSPIVEREPIHWPAGARVAFYVGLMSSRRGRGPSSGPRRAGTASDGDRQLESMARNRDRGTPQGKMPVRAGPWGVKAAAPSCARKFG
jgi:hypothetical protein